MNQVKLYFFIFSGHNHLKKLVKQKVFKKVSDEKLLRDAKQHFARQKPKDKLISRETGKGNHAFISNTYKLLNKLTRPNRKHIFASKITSWFSKQSPLVERNQLTNVPVPKTSLVKHPTGGPRDSFIVVSEENGSTRNNNTKDDALLENLMENENDSDSHEPITNDSDEHENEDDSTPGHVRGEVVRTSTDNDNEHEPITNDSDSHEPITNDSDEHENEDDSTPKHVHEGVDRASTDNEKRPEEDTEDKHMQGKDEDEHETAVSMEDDDDNDVDDEDEDKDSEEKDEKKPSHEHEDNEQQGHSKNMRQDNNITPYEISNQMNHDMMRIYGGTLDQTAAMMDRVRHLQAVNKLRAFNAQIRQEMLQRLRLSDGNTFGQTAAFLPQFYIPQPLRSIPRVPLKAPLLLGPTSSIYRQPAYVDPPRSTSPLAAESSNRGYSINVDGLHGVFSKSPGYVVRFHSPNSEVTVVKKEQVIDPMTTTHVLQIEAG